MASRKKSMSFFIFFNKSHLLINESFSLFLLFNKSLSTFLMFNESFSTFLLFNEFLVLFYCLMSPFIFVSPKGINLKLRNTSSLVEKSYI